MDFSMHIIILSGGVGSRLWPVSRDLDPKPFMKLSDGESFLQKVFVRSASIPSVKSITTVTNKNLFFKTVKEYNDIREKNNILTHSNFIIEPFGRNTAAAIAMASVEIGKAYGTNSTVLVLPSDHLILDQPAFIQVVHQANELAKSGKIVTFGIKPYLPETGYGYIEANGTDVIRFVEKPSLEQAKIYLNSGNFLWNSGMFCFSVETILREMETCCPDILEATVVCLQTSKSRNDSQMRALDIDPTSFAKVPSNSIDYALMEKTTKSAVVPCDIGWSDIGNWGAINDISDLDDNSNMLKGDIVIHDVTNCYIEGSNRVIGAVGLDNIVIVDTPDALLVAHKNSVQDVKNIYSQLKETGNETHKSNRTVERPWGSYTILEEGPGFKIKRIEVTPGASLSLQMHNHRAEHWVVISGQALVINGDDEFMLNFNESTYIPAMSKHRLTNPGDEKLIIIEVQTGAYLGEDDIIRFDDIYGRCANAA